MENSFVGSLQLQDHPNPDMTITDIWNNNMRDQVPKKYLFNLSKYVDFKDG
jgi:hypothetical protein